VTGAGLRALVGKGTSNRTTFFREMNFYEKALFVKPTWRHLCGVNATALPFARYASIRCE
jgi:hypothetical protein